MQVLEAIRARRSIRVFKKRPVSDEKLQRILEAGRLAPSARNVQEWKFIVVRHGGLREQLMQAAKNQYFVGSAPVVIVGCALITDYTMSCGQLAYPVDLSIALTQMMLQAVEEGLGSCWVGAFDEARVKTILKIPQSVRVVGLLPIGHPDEDPPARSRKTAQEVFCYDEFA